MSVGRLMEQGPMGHMHNGSLFQQLIIIVVLLLLVVIVLLFYRWPRPAPAEKSDEVAKEETGGSGSGDKLEVALRLLDENERRVVEALVAEGGSMLQKDISFNLGFSRVKTHSVVQSLVKRGLVTAEEHFNTNKVTLVDWLRE